MSEIRNQINTLSGKAVWIQGLQWGRDFLGANMYSDSKIFYICVVVFFSAEPHLITNPKRKTWLVRATAVLGYTSANWGSY